MKDADRGDVTAVLVSVHGEYMRRSDLSKYGAMLAEGDLPAEADLGSSVVHLDRLPWHILLMTALSLPYAGDPTSAMCSPYHSWQTSYANGVPR